MVVSEEKLAEVVRSNLPPPTPFLLKSYSRDPLSVTPELFVAMRIDFNYVAKGIFTEANLFARTWG
jgi:hypothetical protein